MNHTQIPTPTADVTSVIELDILTTRGLQLREGTNGKTVTLYCERYKLGAGMDPIIVFVDEVAGHTYLADGHHRVAAARRAGLATLPCVVKFGDRRAAIFYAAGVNARHGLPLSAEDKRKIVDTLLADDEWRALTDRAIAEHCHVSPYLVAKRRKKLPKELQSDIRKNKKGVVMQTANIGKLPKAPPPAPEKKPEPDDMPIVVLDEPEELKIDDSLSIDETVGTTSATKKTTGAVGQAATVKTATPSSLAHDEASAQTVKKQSRQLLAEKLIKGKHQWTGTERQLVSLALVVGVPCSADDPTWSDDLQAQAFTLLADRLQDEVADRITRDNAHRLPPVEMLAKWWGIDFAAITMTVKRF